MNFVPFEWAADKVLPGSGLRYRVELKDYVLTGANGSAEASMFGFSYIVNGGETERPVAFAYNGGPGAASGWVHMGLLGPEVIKFPGYPDIEAPAGHVCSRRRRQESTTPPAATPGPLPASSATGSRNTAAAAHRCTS